MDIPYGFDCYSFSKNEIKFFEPNVVRVRQPFQPTSAITRPSNVTHFEAQSPMTSLENHQKSDKGNYIMFTRKNEDYTIEQLRALVGAGRLNLSESAKDSKIFCGIKIQIGIGVVTNFLQHGLQYRTPIKGRSELVNGTWTGIVSGLTIPRESPNSYDVAVGNFLAYDEDFPYIKFGPFFAIESKLVVLTGSSRQIEASSFGTNLNGKVWLTVFILMLLLSLLAAYRVQWQRSKHRAIDEALKELAKQGQNQRFADRTTGPIKINIIQKNGKDYRDDFVDGKVAINPDQLKTEMDQGSQILMSIQNFFFIYFTMLLNKPSLEFDDLIWPKHHPPHQRHYKPFYPEHTTTRRTSKSLNRLHQDSIKRKRRRRRHLPTSIRVVSYLWSAACLVMASIYSGEMLAVILLHADQNIDTISQLINSQPRIEPVIRQDDFTYNLMLKSLDQNMLVLHNMTKLIPRTEVYSQRFIESVSNRKQALLGDDELIETIYDIYHKYYPLYKSKVTYLQYPISIMYRKDFNTTLERKLRRGIVQIFEMGLIQRWYQAQKDTYIQFYDTYEKKDSKDDVSRTTVAADPKYKPLSMHHFESFFKLMLMCKVFAFVVLGLEIIIFKLQSANSSL